MIRLSELPPVVMRDEDIEDRLISTALLRPIQDNAWNAYLAADADLMYRTSTWLPGDFDPRSLRRRTGWALRRYRGEHRQSYWRINGDPIAKRTTPSELRDEITAGAELVRRRHLRSLRRPFDPRPVFLGTRLTNLQFYGVPSGPEDAVQTATLTLEQPENQGTFPVLLPRESVNADDADTGPIITAATPTKESTP